MAAWGQNNVGPCATRVAAPGGCCPPRPGGLPNLGEAGLPKLPRGQTCKRSAARLRAAAREGVR
eukprot:6989894-Lingulodinium_polyedra.AAC.1